MWYDPLYNIYILWKSEIISTKIAKIIGLWNDIKFFGTLCMCVCMCVCVCA